jgi:hypothetical protein
MSPMIRYKTEKGVSTKLGNAMTESHGLDVDRKSHPRPWMLTYKMAWDTQ